MNQCDHNHNTKKETRLLPTGGDGNMIVCHIHYLHEMKYRREMVASGTWAQDVAEFPKWESLKVYEQAAQ